MALSGSFYTNVGARWRLQMEWSATQDITANTSTVKANLYWIALDSYGAVTSSATKDGSVSIDGTASTFSGAGLGSLSANQKKLIKTYSKVVAHNSDGTKSLVLGGFFDIEVTLGGTYYGRVNLTNTTITLNTIPRKSTLSSSPSWVAGNPLSIAISRASSGFTHDVAIKVNGVVIKYLYGITTGTTVNFTETENANIFKELAKNTSNWNQATSIELTTKNGTSVMGMTPYAGTCSSPTASTQNHNGSFAIGDTVVMGITRSNSSFTHTIRVYLGTTLINTQTGVTTSYTWSPTSAEITKMYSTVPNANSVATKIEVDTLYSGVKVRAATYKIGTASVVNSVPTFTGSTVYYEDSNPVTKAMTGDATKIIQNASTVRVQIPASAKAVAGVGASMKNYIATLGGEQVSVPYSTGDIVIDFKVINATTDQTLTIKAVDSRNNSTPVTRIVSMIPYSKPTLNGSAKRKNGFDSLSVFAVNGSLSPITINGVRKNSILEVKYRHKTVTETNPSTWNIWKSFTFSPLGETFKATSVTVDLDNTTSHNVEFLVRDAFSTVTTSLVVSSGKPILFVDSNKKSVGVGKFPTKDNTLEAEKIEANSISSVSSSLTFVNAYEVNTTDINATGVVTTDGITANYINIEGTADTGVTTQNVGLRVGSENAPNVKIDGNEVIAQTNGVSSTLHLQTEGGNIVLWNNTPNYPSLTFEQGYIKNEDYIYPSLSSSWANYSSGTGYQRCSYWKDKLGIVHISGMIRYGTAPLVFTLPVGYRPANQHIFTTHGASSASTGTAKNAPRVDVLANGQVNITANLDAGWTTLAGIHFKAEA